MPLWAGYDKYVGSQVADLTNTPNYNFAGSITAALFLQRFVERTPWVHIDTYAWNAEALPPRWRRSARPARAVRLFAKAVRVKIVIARSASRDEAIQSAA